VSIALQNNVTVSVWERYITQAILPQVLLVRQGSHLSREVVDTHQVRTQRAHGLLVQPGIPVHFL